MKIFITGGAGFIGSHAAEYYARRGDEVVVYDNLSRMTLLGKSSNAFLYNWEYLGQFKNVKLVKGDILDFEMLVEHIEYSDVIIHTAGQTGVTISYEDPILDFNINALGTLNVLEAARRLSKAPTVIYCSTNKVYGTNVNRLKLIEEKQRYRFSEKKYSNGIDESFSVDHCERSPYGCSKMTGELYMQDYSSHYGIRTGIFRMSCIYGPRQMGVEDQGWLAWFSAATMNQKEIAIYGDGKQVRDVLYIDDLIAAYDAFIHKTDSSGVFNMGGGIQNTISLIELLEQLEKIIGKKSPLSFNEWRPNDQKVYISDIQKAQRELGWNPKVSVVKGVENLVGWVSDRQDLFREVLEPKKLKMV